MLILSPSALIALSNILFLIVLVVLLALARYLTPPKLFRCLGSTKKLFEGKI
ncbi:hypothetical protein KJ557_03030 [Patescibacteria group bacterium]|nr:hypothetical protein [Patescibacteria group bacterium]